MSANAAPAASGAILARGLTKKFDETIAVDAVDLSVPRGSLFGFLGPNGAGKSTTVRMLTGLLRKDAGTIEILGLDPDADPLEVKRKIGVVPDGVPLFDRLTGHEYLTFVGRMHSLAAPEIRKRADELLALVDLENEAGKLIADYSHGMRKKVALCGALIHGPRVLFLDEPFEGIDPVAARTMRDLLTSLSKREITVFLTSHVLEIVDRLCTDVAILARGKVLVSGSLEELKRTGTLEDVFIRTVGGAKDATGLSWIE